MRSAQPADLMFQNSILLMGLCYIYSLTVDASFRVSLLLARLRLCQDQAKCTHYKMLASAHVNVNDVKEIINGPNISKLPQL